MIISIKDIYTYRNHIADIGMSGLPQDGDQDDIDRWTEWTTRLREAKNNLECLPDVLSHYLGLRLHGITIPELEKIDTDNMADFAVWLISKYATGCRFGTDTNDLPIWQDIKAGKTVDETKLQSLTVSGNYTENGDEYSGLPYFGFWKTYLLITNAWEAYFESVFPRHRPWKLRCQLDELETKFTQDVYSKLYDHLMSLQA